MNNTDKKLSTRKAPAEKANMYEDGYEMDGMDGMLYVVKANKKGINRWTKTKSSSSSSEPEEEQPKPEEEKPKKSAPPKVEKAPPKVEKPPPKVEKAPPKVEKPKKAPEPEEKAPEPEEKAPEPEEKAPTRKAPAKKANAHDEGYETDGSDGNPYVVKADKNGIKKWMKQKVAKEKPKRAPTAYTNFIKVTLPELRKKHTDKKTSDCMTLAGAIWKALQEDEKKAFLA